MEKASEDKRKKNAFRRINWGYIGFFIILLLIFLFKKKLFFLALFIFLNWFILYMKLGLGIDSPVEVITFGTFMAGYVYGPAEGLIISGSSLIAISVTGRIKFDKIVINFILFIIAFVAQYLRFMNVALAGKSPTGSLTSSSGSSSTHPSVRQSPIL